MYKESYSAYIVDALNDIFRVSTTKQEETAKEIGILLNKLDNANRSIHLMRKILEDDLRLLAKFNGFLVDNLIAPCILKDQISQCEKYLCLSTYLKDIKQLLDNLD